MFTVAPITTADVSALTDLMEEMDRFYGSTEFETHTERCNQIRSVALASEGGSVLLAHDQRTDAERRLVGFATFSFLWPAVGLTRSLFLKELYVTEALRHVGIGRLLMRGVLDTAKNVGCSRVEWMTERTNAEAQAFYSKIGAQPNTEKVFYRVSLDREDQPALAPPTAD